MKNIHLLLPLLIVGCSEINATKEKH